MRLLLVCIPLGTTTVTIKQSWWKTVTELKCTKQIYWFKVFTIIWIIKHEKTINDFQAVCHNQRSQFSTGIKRISSKTWNHETCTQKQTAKVTTSSIDANVFMHFCKRDNFLKEKLMFIFFHNIFAKLYHYMNSNITFYPVNKGHLYTKTTSESSNQDMRYKQPLNRNHQWIKTTRLQRPIQNHSIKTCDINNLWIETTWK